MMQLQRTAIRRQYHIRKLAQVEMLAAELARRFPNPMVVSGIHELIVNAIEHGNLELGFEEKTMLLRRGTWLQEVQRREALPEYARREVWVTFEQSDLESHLVISDDGQGFDWRYWMQECEPDELPNGRGLRIVRQCGFDAVTFNARGNEVTVTAKWR